MSYRTILDAVRQVAIAASLMMLSSLPAWSQASQVPNAKQQFIGPTGAAYDSGQVFMYVPNTFTKKNTWLGPDQSAINTNPIILDGAGRAKIWGVGSYRQVLFDKNNQQVWDELTIAPPSASTPAASGAGDFLPIGAILPLSGFTTPTNYVLAFGQAISRTTYADAFTTLTISSAATCVATNATISGITSTAQMRVGAPVEASCLSPGTTVATIAGPTSITVTPVAATTGSTTVRVFNYGNGDAVTTFNVPDLRGRVLPGADGIGGAPASRLTSTYYGVSATPPGAASTSPAGQSQTLVTSNLPPYTPSGSVTITDGRTWTADGNPLGNGPVNPSVFAQAGAGLSATPIKTITPSGSITGSLSGGTPQGGTSTPFSNVQPSLTVNYAIKVLNGTLPVVGVFSVGGMTGDILCGSHLTCLTQTIDISTNLSGITLTSSTINSTPIGATVPSTGNFSALTINGVPVNTSSDSFWALAGADISYNAGNVSTTQCMASANLPISPLCYGAKCDGVTDDHLAFNSARDAAAAGNKLLQLPTGNCIFGANSFTLTSDLTTFGSGQNSTILTFTGANGFRAGGFTLHASDFRIVSGGIAIQIGDVGVVNFFSTVERVYFRIVGEGVHCKNCGITRIQNNNFQGVTTAFVVLEADINPDGGDSWITNNYGDSSAGAYGIYHAAGGGWSVTDNKFVTLAYGYFMNSSFGAHASSSLLIRDNKFEGNSQAMIAISNADGLGTLFRVMITNNQGGADVYGVIVSDKAGVPWIGHLMISNNVVTNTNLNTGGISVAGGQVISVNNNVVSSLSGTGINGILVTNTSDTGFVLGNTITGYTNKVVNNGINVTDANNGP